MININLSDFECKPHKFQYLISGINSAAVAKFGGDGAFVALLASDGYVVVHSVETFGYSPPLHKVCALRDVNVLIKMGFLEETPLVADFYGVPLNVFRMTPEKGATI